MDEATFWANLGAIVREQRLGVLPEEESRRESNASVGHAWFQRQMGNIKRLYCTEEVRGLVQDSKKMDVTAFCATLIDLFAAYFGVVVGTMILVQIYKIGADRICG